MKITILAFGTRGDVQPFIALGLGLKKAGYTVTIAAPNEFQEFVETHDLNYSSLHYDISKDVTRALNDQLGEKKKNPLTLYMEQKDEWPELITTWLDKSYEACQGCDFLLFTGLAMMYGVHLAEKLGVPSIPVYLGPATPTSDIPLFVFPDLKLGGWYNRLSYTLYNKSEWLLVGKAINKWRQKHGLSAVNNKDVFTMKHTAKQPTIYGFSSAVFPKPSDWGEHIYVPGYFFLEQESTWEPPQALINFLEAGPVPIYIGFGSLNFMSNAHTIQLILKAVKRTKQRAVLATAWKGIQEADVPEDVYVIDSVPHQWLFPRVKAVVHHGGSGTTAEGLRAGRPTATVPIGIADVAFWGRQVHRIGAGPKPIAVKKLTADALEQSIQEVVNNPMFQERAHAIGEQIRNEDGVANAVTIIHQIFAR